MSLRSKLLASALAGALILAPFQVHIQKEGESFSFSVKRAEAFAPAPVAFTALAEAFTSALPAALASAGLGLAVVGLGVLVWKKDTIVDFLKEYASTNIGDVGNNVVYTSSTQSVSSSLFPLKIGGTFLGYPILGWETTGSCSSEGLVYVQSFFPDYCGSDAYYDYILYCYGGSIFRIYFPPCSLISLDSNTLVRPDLLPGSLQNLSTPDEFYSDVSQVPDDVVVVDVPPADDSVPEDSLLYVSPDGIFVPQTTQATLDGISTWDFIGTYTLPDGTVLHYYRSDNGTLFGLDSDGSLMIEILPDGTVIDHQHDQDDVVNPADTAVTDSADTAADVQNPADTAVTDSSSTATDVQNPADTATDAPADTSADTSADTATDNPTDVIVKNPADIAKAIDDVASKSVPTANSTALPDVPTFNTTVSTPEVPNILDKFKSIASSLKLTDKVTTSFSGSCSISGSLDLWGNSVPYNIDFCPYAPYLEQAGDILVMVSGFAALLIMFGL